MTAALREVGREAFDRLLPLMAALQEVERGLNPNRVPGAQIAPHLECLFDAVEREGGFVLVAEDPAEGPEAEPIGFLVGLVCVEGGAYTLPENRRYGEIADLYVAPRARRRGLGRALIEAAERRFAALGLGWMEIGAIASNAPARALYEAAFGAPAHVNYGKALTRDPATS